MPQVRTTRDAHDRADASAWVCRFATFLTPHGRVLDVACGSGRHARYLAAQGHQVVAVDSDVETVRGLADTPGITPQVVDLEQDGWPYAPGSFDGIIVTNYLHRPLFEYLLEALAPRGILIYETFAAGNERYGRPRNPDFLLRPGELLEVVRDRLKVLAFEDLYVDVPKAAVVQRICATLAPPE